MKNKEFFYQQYDKIRWENQEKTKINSFIYDYIVKEVVSKKKDSKLKIFDIGFGIGFFLRQLSRSLGRKYSNIVLEGCEPSYKNYRYFKSKPINIGKGTSLRIYNKTFQDVQTDEKFDFVTSIYTFTAFVSEELEESAKKIYSMLDSGGKFVLVVADEKYLDEKLKAKRDLFIEKNTIELDGKKYKETLHYSEMPQIGTIIDYNREERFYLDLFKKHKFNLIEKKNLDDNGFICTIFVFEKR